MARYILKRLFQSIIVLVIVTLLVFLVMHSIPGNPVQLYLGDGATREQIEHYTELFTSLDKGTQPFVVCDG